MNIRNEYDIMHIIYIIIFNSQIVRPPPAHFSFCWSGACVCMKVPDFSDYWLVRLDNCGYMASFVKIVAVIARFNGQKIV